MHQESVAIKDEDKTKSQLINEIREQRKSQQRIRLVFDATNDGVWEWDTGTGQSYLSPRFYTMLGYEPNEFSPTYEQCRGLIHPDDVEPTEAIVQRAVAERSSYSVEFRMRTKNGAWCWILSRGKATEIDSEGRFLHMVGTHTEISNHKQIEEAQYLAQSIFEKANIGIYVITPSGQIKKTNPKAASMLGYTTSELERMSIFDVDIHIREMQQASYWEKIKEGRTQYLESEHRKKDGSLIPVELCGDYLEYQGQRYGIAFIQDISERKQKEDALREKNDLLQNIGRLVKIGAWKLDIDTGKITATDEVSRLCDFEQKRDATLEIGLGYYHGKNREKIEQAIHDAIEQKSAFDLELEFISAKGIRKWVRTIGAPVIEQGRVTQVQGSLQDITDKKNTEIQLRESEKRFQSLINTIPDLIWLKDPDGVYLLCNQMFERFFGAKEADIVGKTDHDFVEKELADYFRENDRRAVAAGTSLNNEEWVTFKDDGHRALFYTTKMPMYATDGTIVGTLSTSRDITKSRQAEESLRLARTIIDSANIGIYQIAPDGQIKEVNKRAADLLGYSKEDLETLSIPDIDPQISRDRTPSYWQEMVHKKRNNIETLHRTKDGFLIPVEINSNLLEYEGQGYVIAFVQDISQRKQNEEALREKDALLYDIGRLVKIGAWKLDIDTGKITATDEVYRICDFDLKKDATFENGLDYYHGKSREKIEQAIHDTIEHRTSFDLELEILSDKGVHKWVRTVGAPVIKEGRVVQVQGSLHDITEHKQIENSLCLTQFIFDKAPIGIWRMKENGDILDVNEEGCNSLGYTREELCRMSVFDFDLEYRHQNWDHSTSTLRTFGSEVIESKHLQKDGRNSPIQITQKLLQFDEQEFRVAFVQDISERKQAEEELRRTKELAEQEQAKWLTVLEHASNAIEVFDTSAKRIYANPAALQIYDIPQDELSWESISNNFAVQSYPDHRELKEDDWPISRVLRGKHIDGEIFFVRRLDKQLDSIVKFYASPIYNAQGQLVLAVFVENDITEQVDREKKDQLMQERMEQTQRLESLGVLAGGIAHDFNNLLMAVLGNADIALLKLPQPSPVSENLKNIKTVSLRAADLCTQLLAYSGRGRIEEKEFSMSTLVNEMAQMLKTSISKTCILNLTPAKELPLTIGDSSQIRQIVMNFVINASEAIGTNNGMIKVSTSSRDCELGYFTDDYVIKPEHPGHYVTLEVSDNGPGMSKETLGRIFEPFFTTKFTGRGLGLSAILGIIRSHGGGLRVSSKLGVGTTFKVFFPAIKRQIPNPTVSADTDIRNIHFAGTVLLVDDEEFVRMVCTSQLEMLGLEVLTARDGLEGIELYRKNQAEINLVILDLTMPKMGGEETFRQLTQLNHDVQVVLASGYTEDEVSQHFAQVNPAGYLRKPYTLKNLASVLSRLFTHIMIT